MAKKTTPKTASAVTPKTVVAKTPAPAVEVTPVRNSVVPPKSIPAATPAKVKSAPTYEAIALTAYFMWKKNGGSEVDNWVAAERELRSI
jgi:hypothetical protein